MDILSRQRRSKVGISTQFKFAIEFTEDKQTRTVEVLARTKKKALNYFRKHYPSVDVIVLHVYSPKERKRYAPNIQKTFASEEAKRITNEVFGHTNTTESVQ